MIKSVLFDIDNTLIDFMRMKRAAVDAAVEAMIDAGLKVDKTKMVEKIFDVYWKEGVEDQKIFDKVLLKEHGKIDFKILASGIIGYRRAKAASMTPYPHARLALIELMKMGIRCAVISDAPKLEVWLRIVDLGLPDYFDHIVTSADFGVKKPDPQPFRKALELLDCAPHEAIMVGDWADRDIAGAKKLGIKTAWAKYGDTFDTKDSGADYELADIIEILDIIRKENGNVKAAPVPVGK
ncbi:MAG: TIGR02253 family HAD-type hydrolase [Elusimicrobia bacterium]|nr:TIGR02253 family HAD-type hydrolase [Elusimicrobiota bacterium]